MASPLGSPALERRWQGAEVDLEEVIDQLRRLEGELAQQDPARQEHPHPRNSVLNLVALCDDRDRAELCDGLVQAVAASHPLRAILVHLDIGPTPPRLAAEITLEAHPLPGGIPVQREQVLLRVGGAPASHLGSLIEPLLLPDLPTYVWWTGRHHVEGPGLREALGACDVLVVDSITFERPAATLLELTGLADQLGDDVGISDLRWQRLRPWREAIAQFFAPQERRPLLTRLREVRLECAGRLPAHRVGAALVAGWMASALGWRFERVTPRREEATEAECAGGPRVSLRSAPSGRLPEGLQIGVHLAGHSGRRRFALDIELDRERGDVAQVSADLGGGSAIGQRLMMPAIEEAELLFRVLAGGRRDTVFARALAAAAPLLESLT